MRVCITFILLVSSFILTHASYLAAVSGNNNDILVWVSENGTVATINLIPSVNDAPSIISHYYTFGQTYYALHDTRYLFSYNVASNYSQTLTIQARQGTLLPVFCLSQQLGNLYAIQVTGISTVLVHVDPNAGSVSNAAQPISIPASGIVQQCIVDDAFSRIIWTYVDTASSTYSIVSTDILPNNNGGSTLLNTNNLQQPWLFYNWKTENFYATSISFNSPQLWELSVTIDGVQLTQMGTTYKAVSFTSAMGALNINSGIISVFSAGIIAQVNVVNATWSHLDMQWGSLGVMSVSPMSVTYVHP